tara:strand:- start:78 stop:497 length:420 start_codon:yes stop_codon:yes gene_type:complete
MTNVNNIFTENIDESTFTILSTTDYTLINYNDKVLIEKIDSSKNKYYFKSINDKYIILSNLKYKSEFNKNYKYFPIKILRKNILNIYRQSKMYSDLDLMKIFKKIKILENENQKIKNKLNNIIEFIKETNSSTNCSIIS